MLTLIKIVFIVVAGIFIVSYLNDTEFLKDFTLVGEPYAPSSDSTDAPIPRGAYTGSYDTNNDGTISEREYQHGEEERIKEELDYLRTQLAEILAKEQESPFADSMSLSQGNAEASDPDEEYVEVRADLSGTNAVTITGWRLKSLSSGYTATIGKGVPPNRTSLSEGNEKTVTLKPAEKAYVVTGDPRSKRSFEEDANTLAADDWIVLLDASRALWRNSHDVILLLDGSGLVVDYVSY